MLRIRLRRTGKKKQPSYRVVVADQRSPRDGAFVEVIGHYNPRTSPRTLVLEEDRVRYWLSKGAQPSDTMHRLLHDEGLIDVAPPQRHTSPSKAELRDGATTEEAAPSSPAAAAVATAASSDTDSAETADTDTDTAEAASAELESDDTASAETEPAESDSADDPPSEDSGDGAPSPETEQAPS